MTPTEKMPEVFKADDVQFEYNKIMKEGYISKGAGDMWEPNYRPDDLALFLNKFLSERLKKYFGYEDLHGDLHIGTEYEDGDNFAIYGMKVPLVKEPVKIILKVPAYIKTYPVEIPEDLQGQKLKITIESDEG